MEEGEGEKRRYQLMWEKMGDEGAIVMRVKISFVFFVKSDPKINVGGRRNSVVDVVVVAVVVVVVGGVVVVVVAVVVSVVVVKLLRS